MAELRLMHGEGESSGLHVVFVHGLDGDLEGTWLSSSVPEEFWPSWLGQDIEGLWIWSVGYQASKTRWRSDKAMHFIDRGANVLGRLLAEPRLKTGDIVFIGHSMGGLVIKQLLRDCQAKAETHDGAATFISRVRKVAFLATPHSGANLGSIARFARIIIRPSSSTDSLARRDPELRGLNTWYRSWSHSNDIYHLTLVESEPTKLFGPLKTIIVDSETGDPGLLSDPIPVDADHGTICRPASRDSEVYALIKDFLKKESSSGSQRKAMIEQIDDLGSSLATDIRELDSLAEGRKEETITAITRHISELGQLRSGRTEGAEILDKEIYRRLSVIRKSRFFPRFPLQKRVEELVFAVEQGDLSAGSPAAACDALSWCSRFFSATDLAEATRVLSLAGQYGECLQLQLAREFIRANRGEYDGAVARLTELNCPEAVSAAFIIRNQEKGPKAGIEWLSESGYQLQDLDVDGKVQYIRALLIAEEWEEAVNHCAALDPEELSTSPALLNISAASNLVMAVAPELRLSVLSQIPLAAKEFPLSTDQSSLRYLRVAREHFGQCKQLSLKLGCEDIAATTSDYELWLKLRSPETESEGRQELIESMADDIDIVLRRFPLAFAFDISVDTNAIELLVNQKTARSASKSASAAICRFLLATTKEGPAQVNQYLEKHWDQLKEYIGADALYQLKIEALVNSSQIQKAEETLDSLDKDEITNATRPRLAMLIDAAKGGDPLAAAILLYEESDDVGDLSHVVDLLKRSGSDEQRLKYQSLYFKKTGAKEVAEMLADTLTNMGLFSRLFEFLSEHRHLTGQSEKIALHWAWALYRKGDLECCKNALMDMENLEGSRNFQALKVNLAVASGDWRSLAATVERDWVEREERGADELVRASYLAKAVSPGRVMDFLTLAAEKSPEDPEILAACYFAATSIGMETQPDVLHWLQDAVSLSGETGPVYRAPIEDISEHMQEHRAASSNLWKMLSNAEIPYFVAAKQMGRSLADYYLLPALKNMDEIKVKRRIPIPTFSFRVNSERVSPDSIFLDPTSILVLGYLRLLEHVIGCFEKVLIPHGSLIWLFEEKQKISFHQPSRIKDATSFERLLVDGHIQKVESTSLVDAELALEVGEELALLIETAKSHEAGEQGLIVHQYPVTQHGSLSREPVDLGENARYFIGCSSLVKKIRKDGVITEVEEDHALKVLSANDRPWPQEAEIDDNTTIYLDSVAVSYLQSLNLLEKARFANLKIRVHEQEVQRQSELRRYESVIEGGESLLEYVRSVLAASLDSGKVALYPMIDFDSEYPFSGEHPSEDIFFASHDVDAVVADERFINRNPFISHESINTPVLSTIDLIELLTQEGVLDESERANYKKNLRRSGFTYVPVTREEVIEHLEYATIEDGHIVESAQLRGIRESLFLVRMSDLVKLPRDALWLTDMQRVLRDCIKDLWNKDIPKAQKIACSNWLLKLIDFRAWSHCYDDHTMNEIAIRGAGLDVLALAIVDQDMTSANRKQYQEWLDEFVVEPLKQMDPSSYRVLIETLADNISSRTEEISGGE